MPCKSYMPSPEQENNSLRQVLEEQKSENRNMTAILCALLNELERREIIQDVMLAANLSGNVNVHAFYRKHREEDIKRLRDKLSKDYSADERRLIKIMFEEGTL